MKKLFLILSLMFLSSIVFAGYVQTYRVTYDTTTEVSVFTFVSTIEVGTSTGTIFVFLLGTGTVRGIEGVFDYAFIAETLKLKRLISGDAGSVDDIWTRFVSSDSWGEPAAGDGVAGGIAGEILTFYIPGDAYITTGIAYFGPLGYQVTLASAMATVTADGTYPRGAGALNFNIMISSGIAQSPFETIFNSTYSLQMSSGTCWTETTDFRDPILKANYMIRLDIGEICGTFPGGDPICVSLYGTQE